ncbi:hypothetical protein E2C01_037848 [Portunus trituberculatus]|uniref:Uncharacterized protein n=1 Tax=Portunus trituberculatus TaxID=210409 RepID=A0A5B7FCK0_PORTR|nr:hypothetical protein [Portunus trituberculatus]
MASPPLANHASSLPSRFFSTITVPCHALPSSSPSSRTRPLRTFILFSHFSPSHPSSPRSSSTLILSALAPPHHALLHHLSDSASQNTHSIRHLYHELESSPVSVVLVVQGLDGI